MIRASFKIKDHNVLLNWKEALSQKNFKFQLFGALTITILSMLLSKEWLSFNETRVSEVINDPILALFDPIDLSIPISVLTNLGWAIGLVSAAIIPYYLIRALFSMASIALFRIVTMFLVPLEPPANIIPLRDMFLENTFYAEQVLQKDLFFSGHTAVLVLFCMLTPHKKLRGFLALSAVLVGSMLILQHVHYTIDVLMAPIFTLIVFVGSNNATEKYCQNLLVSPGVNKL